jgi:hypothetical protein
MFHIQVWEKILSTGLFMFELAENSSFKKLQSYLRSESSRILDIFAGELRDSPSCPGLRLD